MFIELLYSEPIGQDDRIIYYEDYRLVVCYYCSTHSPQTLRNILRHLDQAHDGPNEIPDWDAIEVELGNVCNSEQDITFKPPLGVTLPIPGIPIRRNGFRCTFNAEACNATLQNEGSMVKHCKKKHGYRSTYWPPWERRINNRPKHQPLGQKPWRGGVSYQRAFTRQLKESNEVCAFEILEDSNQFSEPISCLK
ncbi:hypothetical protein K402DRAFT_77411 [Aulographum hederae CBS 113979]|uniref:Uncharacterized protein n=1 Tax=Aulographum hederae CBS 113979 TaxID=1176131 RepID=A0A6G1HG24_9PEZI|nr:hypothetical protein K402DRAFT_77411 [Aulographum hederae CBS 113979]